jgi:hypothetical protein
MPITPYLDGQQFDAETKRIMGIAFEMTCAALHITPSDKSKPAIARKIIELAQAGERDPNQLCEHALGDLRAGRQVSSQSLQFGLVFERVGG